MLPVESPFPRGAFFIICRSARAFRARFSRVVGPLPAWCLFVCVLIFVGLSAHFYPLGVDAKGVGGFPNSVPLDVTVRTDTMGVSFLFASFLLALLLLLCYSCCMNEVDIEEVDWRMRMANDKLIDVAPSMKGVTQAEIERFKLERAAELVFLDALRGLVGELATKVGPRNTMYASMVRFLKNRVG